MILRLALRSLLVRPVRSAVLAIGFGLGVAVMAALLGIGAVILDQARAPALVGGGDVVVGGANGRLSNATFVLTEVLHAGVFAPQVAVAAPSDQTELYLIDAKGATPLRARGGIPSLERALGDPETHAIAGWNDTPADRAWVAPDPEQVLRALDRFHPVPDVPARAPSWAEWLYFNGRASSGRFYLSFIAGPQLTSGRRTVGVRLQLERGGVMTSFADAGEVDAGALLASAPDLTIGRNRVRLTGREYHIAIDLPGESSSARAVGDLVIRAKPGRALPPLSIRGAGGWVSGYVVPVMSGTLSGSIDTGGTRVNFDGGAGYHDHNWGFWDGVSWQWGQVQGDGLSFVYGRVHPPADAADASRVPGFLMATGPDGPVGYATDVTIDEVDRPDATGPREISVRARGSSLALRMDLAVGQTTMTGQARRFDGQMDFLQLRAEFHVTGQVAGRTVDFTAPGSAETFRGRTR
jgi:hypothetical protein